MDKNFNPRIALKLLPVLAVVPLLILAACSGGEKSNTRTLGNVTFNDHGTKDASGKSSFELEVDDFYFNPTFIKGTPGQTVTLEISSDSSDTTHNFSLASQNVSTDIPQKGKAEVKVTIPQSGVLQFFCKFHTGQGMNGELLSGNASPQAPSSNTGGSGTNQPTPSSNTGGGTNQPSGY